MNELLLQGLSELGLDVSRAETLERFSSLLLEKNEVMNLTAITEPDAVAQLHLLDSAALLPFVDLTGKTVVDVGTGAGFPGMRAAISWRRITRKIWKRLDFTSSLSRITRV